MRVCLISTEIFAWGKHGGFGRATRLIGRELARRGVETYAVVPRRRGQLELEDLDGITVLGFPPGAPWRAAQLFRQCRAHIYHSQDPSLASYLAMRAMPDRVHIVTCRDPRDWPDWRLEFERPSLTQVHTLANALYEGAIAPLAVRRADRVFCAAEFLRPKLRRMYRLARDAEFLPTPVSLPRAVEKSATPTVCFVARLDRRKRPEVFFDLAAQFPEVRFVAAGKSRDPAYERSLRKRYAGLPNARFVGFVDQFQSLEHSALLEASWILVNTASRESLPNAFLEAAAHRCAILSQVDPDGFASEFGYHARTGDFEAGLAWLLEADRWRACGERAYARVRDVFALDRAMQRHLEIYNELIGSGS